MHAEYVAEMVPADVCWYGEQTYVRGLKVYTSIKADDQQAAYDALRRGIMDYERRQAYRGPGKSSSTCPRPPTSARPSSSIIGRLPAIGDHWPPWPRPASARSKRCWPVATPSRSPQRLARGPPGLSPRAAPAVQIRPGAVIRVVRKDDNSWDVAQLPEVSAVRRSIRATARQGPGGRPTTARTSSTASRRPGASPARASPFVYSAALEKGFSPTTIVDDAPLFFDASVRCCSG